MTDSRYSAAGVDIDARLSALAGGRAAIGSMLRHGVVGTIVGVVEKEKVLDGSRVREGDVARRVLIDPTALSTRA